jgi:hypothetical protein
MKTNHQIHWIRIALLCMALAFVVILMTIPLLAKGISHVMGNPVEPEKLDIRPIPAPVTPVQFVLQEPSAKATPAPSPSDLAPVVQAVPVPTPLIVTAQTSSVLAQNLNSRSSSLSKLSMVRRPDVVFAALTLLILLILVRLQQTATISLLNRKNA